MIEALDLIVRHAGTSAQFYPPEETVVLAGVVRPDWEDLLVEIDSRGRKRIVCTVYEACVLQALRDRLRCKEIWVVGAHEWRNPDEDLPADFEAKRAEHYEMLHKPLDAGAFVHDLQEQLRGQLAALNEELPSLDWLEFSERKRGHPAHTAEGAARAGQPAPAQEGGPGPVGDGASHRHAQGGGAAHRDAGPVRPGRDPGDRARRPVGATSVGGLHVWDEHRHRGGSPRRPRPQRERPPLRSPSVLHLEGARAVAIEPANATFAARQIGIWGESTSTVASDSTHFRSYDQNLCTEWHSRYGGRGVLIYWHVEKKSMVVHSQLLSCTASEVAATVEGAVRHGTTMALEGNYVDSHGQSEIGFAIPSLLDFFLLPRIKRINKIKLYGADQEASPRLAPAMTRAIRWDLIEQNYDQMIKFATAIRVGTASAEAILRRFTRNATPRLSGDVGFWSSSVKIELRSGQNSHGTGGGTVAE